MPMAHLNKLLLCLFLCAACTGKYLRPTTDEKVAATAARLDRGRYLVNAIGACGGCHSPHAAGNLANPEDADRLLSGGNWLQDGEVGLFVPNLSSDVETGLGGWTDDEIMRAIRDGISKDGHTLAPMMPYDQYQYMSDDDVRAVVAYLRTVPAGKPVLPKRDNQLPFGLKMAMSMGGTLHTPVKDVRAPAREDKVAWGRYVARLGHCSDCHTLGSMGPRAETERFMAGSDVPMQMPGVGKVWPSNLTPDLDTGVGKATDEQLKASLRSGKRLDGKLMAAPMAMLMPHFALMSGEDLDALVAWMRTLPPVTNKVPARVLEAAAAKELGE
jgi:mono/diheme cytochrome c family protein